MARNLTADMITEILAGSCRPIFFVSIKFLTSTQYMWTGIGDLVWNGMTFKGVGDLGAISPIGETTEVNALNVTLSLSGIPTDLLGYAMNECRTGYPVLIWFGFLTSAGAVVADPYKAWSGSTDVPTLEEGGDTCKISITAESSLLDMNRAANRRYTDADQKRDYAIDDGMIYVPGAANWDGCWGSAGPGSSAGGPSVGRPPGTGNPGGSGSGGGPGRPHPGGNDGL